MINSVKFKAKIKQGFIEIPEVYKTNLPEGCEVKVIITADNQPNTYKRLMDELAENPFNVQGWTKLTRDEIHNRKE